MISPLSPFDDIGASCNGQRRQVRKELPKAICALNEAIEEELQASIAHEKTAVVVSDKALAQEISAEIGASEEACTDGAAQNLGIDFMPGRKRAEHGQNSKWKRRLLQAKLRKARIRQVKERLKKGKQRLQRIFWTGVKPALGYGASVNGVSAAELHKIRQTLLAGTPPFARGSSLTTKLSIVGDPAWQIAVAPITAWAGEVWRAVTETEGPHMTCPQLSRAHRAEEENAARKGKPRTWRTSTGPVAACKLSLARLGWKMKNAFVLIDERGDEIVMTQNSPALVAELLKQGGQRQIERKLARKLGGEAFQGRRAYTGVAATLVGKKQQDPRRNGNKNIIRNLACDAIWTNKRAKEAGLPIDSLCALCEKEEDTIKHRLWNCRCEAATKARYEARIPKWFLETARRAKEDDPLYCKGFFPHPADVFPRPALDAATWCEGPGGQQIDGKTTYFQGSLFADGSCTRHAVAEFSRAAFAIVEVDTEGAPANNFLGVVSPPLPQTPQAAEFLGYGVATQLVDKKVRENTLYDDCLNVVKAVAKPIAKRLSPAARYAGILRSALQFDREGSLKVEKVQAHQEESGEKSEAENFLIKGNNAADTAAKRALSLHPAFPQDAENNATSPRRLGLQNG